MLFSLCLRHLYLSFISLLNISVLFCQAFTIVSGLLLAQEAITQQHFDEYLLLPLCQLQSDSVANVRLTLARALSTHVITKPMFNSEETRSNCIYGQELFQVWNEFLCACNCVHRKILSPLRFSNDLTLASTEALIILTPVTARCCPR